MRRSHASFHYQAGSWTKPRRVIAKVEWHPGDLYPRVGFLVTNMVRPAENVVAFYNKRGMCEQWIKEGKGAIRWTRLSCHSFAANAVRLQLHALAYNLGNFLRTLATPEPIKDWSLTLSALKDHDPEASITTFMRAPVETVRRTAPLEAVLDRLHGQQATALAVTDPEGVLIGLLTRQNLAEMMIIKTMRPNWRFDRG